MLRARRACIRFSWYDTACALASRSETMSCRAAGEHGCHLCSSAYSLQHAEPGARLGGLVRAPCHRGLRHSGTLASHTTTGGQQPHTDARAMRTGASPARTAARAPACVRHRARQPFRCVAHADRPKRRLCASCSISHDVQRQTSPPLCSRLLHKLKVGHRRNDIARQNSHARISDSTPSTPCATHARFCASLELTNRRRA
jgi:hypothetical protein